jgi:hypothetical protein
MFVVTGATLFAGDSPASQPKTCPFGHTTLSWRKVESADIPRPGKELFCTTCGFAYEEQLSRWERAVSFSELTTGILPDFPDVIRDFPVPKEKKELPVWFVIHASIGPERASRRRKIDCAIISVPQGFPRRRSRGRMARACISIFSRVPASASCVLK